MASNAWNDSDSDSEEETTERKSPMVIVALDTHESMFNSKNETDFLHTLKACFDLVDSLVCVDARKFKSPLCLLLAGIEDDGQASLANFDHQLPDVHGRLKKMLKDDDLSSFKRQKSSDFAALLLCCQKKFMEKSNEGSHIIVYVTNDDDPVQDATQRLCILKEAQHLKSLQMQLHVVTLNSSFEVGKFYKDVFEQADSEVPVQFVQHPKDLRIKLSSYFKVQDNESTVKFYPFKNDISRSMDLTLKKVIKEAKIRPNSYCFKKDLREIVKVTEVEDVFNSEGVSNTSSGHTERNLKESNWPLGYVLLYVNNPVSEEGFVLEESTLLTKSHAETETFFNDFWLFCKDHTKVMVCMRKYRKNGRLTLVELSPTIINDEPAFFTKVLPYLDDFARDKEIFADADDDYVSTITDEQLKAAKDLVDSLTFDYHPSMFSDDVYRNIMAYVKSELLEEEPEEVKPFCINFDEEITKTINAFKDACICEEPSGSGGKRKAKKQTSNVIKKK